jgi:hypothetical protein
LNDQSKTLALCSNARSFSLDELSGDAERLNATQPEAASDDVADRIKSLRYSDLDITFSSGRYVSHNRGGFADFGTQYFPEGFSRY